MLSSRKLAAFVSQLVVDHDRLVNAVDGQGLDLLHHHAPDVLEWLLLDADEPKFEAGVSRSVDGVAGLVQTQRNAYLRLKTQLVDDPCPVAPTIR